MDNLIKNKEKFKNFRKNSVISKSRESQINKLKFGDFKIESLKDIYDKIGLRTQFDSFLFFDY